MQALKQCRTPLGSPPRISFFARAFLEFLRFDYLLARRNFKALYDGVRNYPVGTPSAGEDAISSVIQAVDHAALCYYKRILCLQHSAAVTCLLRRYGVRARMIIGAQQLPFQMHAWVEVHGQVVNDKPYMREMYQVLDEC